MPLGFLLQLFPGVSQFQLLFDLYLTLGTAVAVVVIGWLIIKMILHRERERTPFKSHAEGKPETWKSALTMVLITASILATVEIGTFLSTGLVIAPNDPNAIHINVIAHQFEFDFQYPNGNLTLRDLIIPTGKAVILNITSQDVFHSFGIRDLPSGPVSEDAIPGEHNVVYIPAQQTEGTFVIRCYELCGVGHYTMTGNLKIVSPSAYSQLNYSG